MTVDNLATVFTPTLMRPKIDDPMSALIELKICQKVVFSLLLDKMEGSIKTTLSAGMVDRLARNSRR